MITLSQPVRKDLTFENFVVGDSNRTALRSAQAVAAGRSEIEILTICGPVGSGKTHLLQAIANSVIDERPGLKVAYLPVVNFVQGVVYTARKRLEYQMQHVCQQNDLILLDEVDKITGVGSQAELVSLINALFLRGPSTRLVTTVSAIEALGHLSQELSSRLMGGLVVEIGVPDIELRRVILFNHAHRNGVELTEEVVDSLAGSSIEIRTMLGTFYRILEESRATGVEISKVLASLFIRSETLLLDDIIIATAMAYGLEPAHLLSRDRRPKFAEARQVAMYLCRELTTDSYPIIPSFRPSKAFIIFP